MNPRPNQDVFDELMDTITDRKSASPEDSYTASLFSAGLKQICLKISEEAAELVDAAQQTPGSRQHQVHETADLVYHVWVLLAQQNIPLADVRTELTRRFGTSGLREKAARTDPHPDPDQS